VIYLPDTNVFSRYLRDRPEDAALGDRLEAVLPDCRLSAIVLMELEYGAEKSPNVPAFRTRIIRLREVLSGIAPFDEAAAQQAGFVRAWLGRLKPNAQPIGPYDALLAGHALSLGAVFVTGNIAEFSRVPGLVVEDWRAPLGKSRG
jgi:tRNA(fMet)-specific endonuclease VapC